MAARVLIAAWAGSTNLGDELIQSALVAKLAQRGCALAAISVAPQVTREHHRIGAIADRDVAGLWAAAGQADALVFGGGGIIQDSTSLLNLPYHLARPALARLRSTPWAGVGLGVGPLETGSGRRLTRMLRSAVAVSVRDRDSARVLAEAGVPGAVVAADLAFSLPAPQVAPADAIVACLRPWSGGGRLPVSTRGDRTQHGFVAAAARALDEAADRTGLPVRLVAFQPDRDGPLHRRIAQAMRTEVDRVEPGLDAVLREVARSRVVVGMRYHATIAAVLAGRPCVAIGYAPKVDALAGELGPGGRLLDHSAEDLARLPDAVEAIVGHDDAVVEARERLRERERGNDEVIDALLDAAGQPPGRGRR